MALRIVLEQLSSPERNKKSTTAVQVQFTKEAFSGQAYIIVD